MSHARSAGGNDQRGANICWEQNGSAIVTRPPPTNLLIQVPPLLVCEKQQWRPVFPLCVFSFLLQGALTNERDYETLVMMRMRQAAERQRLIEQMQREDEEDAGS